MSAAQRTIRRKALGLPPVCETQPGCMTQTELAKMVEAFPDLKVEKPKARKRTTTKKHVSKRPKPAAKKVSK